MEEYGRGKRSIPENRDERGPTGRPRGAQETGMNGGHREKR